MSPGVTLTRGKTSALIDALKKEVEAKPAEEKSAPKGQDVNVQGC